jgi:hypothetical protein
MAAAPQIPEKVMNIMKLINEQMLIIVAQVEDIHNSVFADNPLWKEIKFLMAATELNIVYVEEDAKELEKLANTEGFPVHMKTPIDKQMGLLSKMFELITSIKTNTSHRHMGSAMNQEDTIEKVRSGLNELLPLARETKDYVAGFYQQIQPNASGGSRRRRSLRSKRSKRCKHSKRKQRTHRK